MLNWVTSSALVLLMTSVSVLAQFQQVSGLTAIPFVLGNVDDIEPDTDALIIEPSKPLVVDINSKPLSAIKAYTQSIIAINATNHDKARDWACVVIAEVRSSDSVTVWLNWHSQVVVTNSTIGLGMSWMPERPDTYTIRTFVISSLSDPYVFSDVKETTVHVQ